MRRWISVIFGILLALSLSLTVYASPDAETIVGDTPPDDSEGITSVQKDGGGATGSQPGDDLQPVDIRRETVGNVPYITKIYELSGNMAPDFSQGFEQDGYCFTRQDTLARQLAATQESKQASQAATAECETDDKAKLLAVTPQEIPYTENGYKGTLRLESGSITFEEGERKSTRYTLTETREYPGLPSNDASYVDKTITKNGVTLELQSIDWEITATSPTDGGLVPTQYKAIASYAGTATGSKVSAYTASFRYSGEVVKSTPGKTIYTVVYRGEPVTAPEPAPTPDKGVSPFLLLVVGICVLSGIALVGVGGNKIRELIESRKRSAVLLGPDETEDEVENRESGLWESWKEETEDDAQPIIQPGAGEQEPDIWPKPFEGEGEPEDDPKAPAPKRKTRPKRSRIPKDETPLVQCIGEDMEDK